MRKKTTVAATFGAALTSVYIAPELNGQTLDLTYNGGDPDVVTEFRTAPFDISNPSAAANFVNIDQVPDTGLGPFDVVVFNNTGFVPGGNDLRAITTNGSNLQLGFVELDQLLKASTFTGGSTVGMNGSLQGSGSRYVGFRHLETNNVGWFKVDFIDDGDVTLSLGEYGSMAEDVTVGGTTMSLLGDFDLDGNVDLEDLDRYNGNIGAAAIGDLEELDLDGDGTVGANDFQQHYEDLVETSNGGKGTAAGDINLDGVVNVLGDAFALVGNLNGTATSWSQGDLNADGTVNVLGDAFLLVGNLGANNGGGGAAPSNSAVPEPGTASLLALATLGVSSIRRRK